MSGRRTHFGHAVVGQSHYMNGRKKSYFVECRSAYEVAPGRIEPAAIVLSSRVGGAPIHYIFCDHMQRLYSEANSKSITIILGNDATLELSCEDDRDVYRWTKHIGLLLTIPLYIIPEEPAEGEFMTELWGSIDPKFYHPQGVIAWGVGALEEGVGSRAGLRNAHCVAVVTNQDKLLVFPWKVTSPALTWDRKHLRRSGNIGNLTFLEAGRRCTFGPGLLWMYSRPSADTPNLCKGMHTFIYKGWQAFQMSPAEKKKYRFYFEDRDEYVYEPSAVPSGCHGESMPQSRSSIGSRNDSGLGKSFKETSPLVQSQSSTSGNHRTRSCGSEDSSGKEKRSVQRTSSRQGGGLEDSLSMGTSFEDLHLSPPGPSSHSNSLTEPASQHCDYVDMAFGRQSSLVSSNSDIYVQMLPSDRSFDLRPLQGSPSYPQHQQHLLGNMKETTKESGTTQGYCRTPPGTNSSSCSIYDNVSLKSIAVTNPSTLPSGTNSSSCSNYGNVSLKSPAVTNPSTQPSGTNSTSCSDYNSLSSPSPPHHLSGTATSQPARHLCTTTFD